MDDYIISTEAELRRLLAGIVQRTAKSITEERIEKIFQEVLND